MTIAYSAPPARPELNPSSPFYATLQAYALFDGAKGMPRDIVHNGLPRRYSGPFGTCYGEDAKVVPGAFPFAPAADGSSSAYAARFTGGSRALAFPLAGFNANSCHASAWGSAATMFCVFKVEDIGCGATGGGTGTWVAQLCGTAGSPFLNGGNGFLSPAPTTGQPTGLCVGGNANGSMYFGFMDDNSFNGTYVCTAAPVVQGGWYLGAVAWYNGTNPTSGQVQNRRVYLHRLDTDARICGTADTTAQTYQNTLGSPAAPGGTNRAYTGTLSNFGGSGQTAHNDFVVGPGPRAGVCGPLVGQVHLAGIDQQFWDNSGQYATIPAAFSGTDPFQALLNDIYGPARGSYATGSGGTTLVNATAQNASNGNILSPIGLGKLAGAYSTVANAVAGVPADLALLFLGDSAVTRISSTQVEIAASRPQAGAAAVTSYSLYGSTTAPFTPGAGNLIATQTVAADPLAHVFQYSPPDTALRFFTVVATDGTNTYTYPQVQAARREKPAVFIVTAGNSYANSGPPWMHLARAGAAWGFDTPVLNFGRDSGVVSDWTAAAATQTGNAFSSTQNHLTWLQAALAREAAALGRPVDLCLCWLVENNTGDTPAAYRASMQTMQAALTGGNLARFSPVPFAVRTLAGGNGGNDGNGVAIGLGLPAADNGTTLVVLGARWAGFGANFAFDQSGAHPSFVQAQGESQILMTDYVTRFIYPSSASAGPRVIGG